MTAGRTYLYVTNLPFSAAHSALKVTLAVTTQRGMPTAPWDNPLAQCVGSGICAFLSARSPDQYRCLSYQPDNFIGVLCKCMLLRTREEARTGTYHDSGNSSFLH